VSRETPEIVAARFEAQRARSQLIGTSQRLQERISPGTLAQNAWEGAKDKGASLAENAVDAVRSRPLAATGVVAAIAMFLAREPLMDLAGKATGKVRSRTRKKPKTRSTEKVA
jgi:hypothetical protein